MGKLPIYECWVMDKGPESIVLAISRDGDFIFKNGYPLPNGLEALKTLCRAELSKLTVRDSVTPIPDGQFMVDLSEPIIEPPPPPPPPTQDELDLAAFVERVELVRKLAVIVPADDANLAALRSQIASDLKAHPEWEDSL